MHGTKLFLLCSLLVLAQLTNAFHQTNEAPSNPTEATDHIQHKISALRESATHTEKPEQSYMLSTLDSNANINSNDNEYTERNKLLIYTLEQFALLSTFTRKQGTKVLRNVVKEAATLKEPTAALQSYLSSFNDYIASADNLANKTENILFSELYDIVVKFTELVEQHNTNTMQGNATTENMFLEMLLKRNGLDKLQVDFLEQFLAFIKKFNMRMESYLKKLTEQQRAEEHNMIEWYRTFTDETDPEKKVDIFTKFFELYD